MRKEVEGDTAKPLSCKNLVKSVHGQSMYMYEAAARETRAWSMVVMVELGYVGHSIWFANGRN